MFLIAIKEKMLYKSFFVKDKEESCAKRSWNSAAFLEECKEIHKKPHDFRKASLAILLLLPTVYYMFYFRLNPNSALQMFNDNLNADKTTQPVKSKSNDEMTIEQSLPICAIGIINSEPISNGINELDFNSTLLEKQLLDFDTTNLTLQVSMGGHYKPPDCRSIYKIAILVPYRKFSNNLKAFLNYIHPFLIRQRLEYKIFIIEQSDEKKKFNKGRLLNAGFLQIQKNYDWHCIIFHDVYLLPIDDRIIYSCPVLPRHMCATIVGEVSVPKYQTLFSGVIALTIWHFKKANGFSNMYWGMGESEDMFQRLHAADLGMTRYKKNIGRYVSLRHSTRIGNTNRRKLLQTAATRYKSDGLNSLTCQMLSYASKPLYTHLVIDVDPLILSDYITEQSVTYKF